MGWMFVPLVAYHGGGAAATLEQLHDHLEDYALHLMNNLGYGAQACYRGPRLYDSPETRAVVVKWVSWFKKHREILESDVVHVRRADGQHLDAVLHVNPRAGTKAMAVIYNPLNKPLSGTVTLPLHLSGLQDKATVSVDDGAEKSVELDRESRYVFSGEVPAKGCVWVTFK